MKLPKEVERRLQEYDPSKGEITLAECGITHEVMLELAARLMNLKGLHVLDIGLNQLTDAGAEAISKLKDLHWLNIGVNQLTDAGAKAISKLKGLHSLGIHYNQITAAGAKAIAKLTGLHSLIISNNQLGASGAEAIAKLVGLRSLAIDHNRLNDAGAEAIGKLAGLQVLNISYSELTDAGANAIADLKSLQRLDIYKNNLTDAGAEAIAKLTGLQVLTLSNNRLTDAGAEAISKLTGLHALSLSGHRLSDIGAHFISNLTGLHELYIASNLLTGVGAEAIAKLTGLSQLDISKNRIGNPQVIIDLCDRILNFQSTPGEKWIEAEPRIDISHNPLRWPAMKENISDTILKETNPAKLKALLESLRDQGSATLDVAGVAMAGVTTHGKTHLSRWIVAQENEYDALRAPIDPKKGTWGYDRYAAIVPASAHALPDVPDLSLLIVDVGGHREQLSAVSNLIYSNVRRSIFVLCVHAQKDFKRGNLGEYYLKLIQSLAANRESHERGHRIFISELVARGDSIPVVIVITHATGPREIQLDEKALGRQFELLDIVVFDPWDISIGSEQIQALRSALARQVWKLKALRKGTLKSFRSVCKAMATRFELEENLDTETPPKTDSITMSEFRAICAGAGEPQAAFQDILAKELAGIGYVAIVGPMEELEDDRILLNPRFVNYYLFSKILGHVDTRRNHGFMRNDWFETLTRGVSRNNKEQLLKLMQHCLVAFKWERAGFEQGIFVPDLLPERDGAHCVKWDDAIIEGAFVVSEFLGEDAFFRFAAHRQRDLDPIEFTSDPEMGARTILLYRNECVVRDVSCKAMVTIDLVDSVVRIAVRGPDFKTALSFGERVKGWMANEVTGELEGKWREALFERLWLELNGASDKAKRTLAVLKAICHLPQKAREESWTQEDMSFWLPAPARNDRDKVRDSVKWLLQNQFLVENSEGGYQMTKHTGFPFIAWLSRKFPP